MTRLSRLFLPIMLAIWPILGASACDLPDHYDASTETLVHVAGGLRSGHLSVLAIGSGGLAAAGADGRSPSLISHMVAALRQQAPTVQMDVTLRGARGMTAENMLEVLRTELRPGRFQLVIWQTGTVEAIHSIDPTELYDTLVDGAALAADSGTDLLLIDPAFSHFLQANTDLELYENAMRQVAALPGVVLFHRFDLTRDWAEDEGIDLERAEGAARKDLARTVHACLGWHLAHMIQGAAAGG